MEGPEGWVIGEGVISDWKLIEYELIPHIDMSKNYHTSFMDITVILTDCFANISWSEVDTIFSYKSPTFNSSVRLQAKKIAGEVKKCQFTYF